MSTKTRINLDEVLEADANRDQSQDEVGHGNFAPQSDFAQDQNIDWEHRREDHEEAEIIIKTTGTGADKLISMTVLNAMSFFADQLNVHAVTMDDLIGIIYRMDILTVDSEIKRTIRKMVRKSELTYLKDEKKFTLSDKSRMLNQVVQFLKSNPSTR